MAPEKRLCRLKKDVSGTLLKMSARAIVSFRCRNLRAGFEMLD